MPSRLPALVPPWVLTIAAMLVVQLGNSLSVGVVEQIGAAGTTWLRMCCGAAILWLIARPDLSVLRRSHIPQLLVLGTGTGLMTLTFLAAVHRIPLGTAVAIEFLGPLTVAALASRNRKVLLLPALALVGVTLMTQPWRGHIDPVGVGFALAAATCWGLYTFYTQRVGDTFSGITGLTLSISIAAVVTLPAGLTQVITGNFSLQVLLMAGLIAVISPVVAFGLEMLALRHMHHTAFGTLLSLEPGFGILFGLVMLGQKPSWSQVLGVACVIVAGALAQRGSARDSATPAHQATPANAD